MKKVLRLLILSICFWASSVSAATYYVDCAADGDDGAGTSTAANVAWKTIAKVNSSSFSGDDNVLFNRGCTWREQLTVPSSGTSGHQITFGAYGTGDKPIITGANIITTSGWAASNGCDGECSNSFMKALTTNPGIYVFEDETILTKVASAAAVDTTDESVYWASDVIYVNPTGSTSPATNGLVYESAVRNILVSQNQKDYITIESIDLTSSTYIGIWASDDNKQNAWSITNCDFSYMNTGSFIHGDDVTISGSSFNYVSRGIELRDIDESHSQNYLLTQNAFTNCGSSTESNAGIIMDSDTYADNSDHHVGVISRNVFTNLQGRAIDGFVGDSLIAYNIVNGVTTGAEGSGLCIEVNGPNNKVYSNVLRNCENIGLMFNVDPMAPDEQSTVKNNIIVADSVNHIVWVTNNAGLSPVFDNNIYLTGPSGGDTNYYWKGTDYTFANWKTQSSGDANSLETDPLFAAPSTGDFTLQATSPAIDAGVNVCTASGVPFAGCTGDGTGTWTDYAGTTVPIGAAPDIGAYEAAEPEAPVYALTLSGTGTVNNVIVDGDDSYAGVSIAADSEITINNMSIGNVSLVAINAEEDVAITNTAVWAGADADADILIATGKTLSGSNNRYRVAPSGAGTNSWTDSETIAASPYKSTSDFRLADTATSLVDSGATISGLTTDFAGTTRPIGSAYDIGAYEADNVPTAFSFTDTYDVEISTATTSNQITVAGTDTAAPITITGGTYSKNGGAYTSDAGTVATDDTVTLRCTSSASYDTAVNVVLTIGGVSDTWTVTTESEAEDVTPDAFTFTDVTGAARSTQYTSNAVTITGINASVVVTITGGTYSKNGAGYTSDAGTAVSNDVFTVRCTSSANYSTATNVALTIGGVSDTYTVTTLADGVPDAFTFVDVVNAWLFRDYTSNTITVAGIDTTAAITVDDGSYSKNGGTFTSDAGTVESGDTIAIRCTSSLLFGTATNVTVTIGGVTDTFTVTTRTRGDFLLYLMDLLGS